MTNTYSNGLKKVENLLVGAGINLSKVSHIDWAEVTQKDGKEEKRLYVTLEIDFPIISENMADQRN